MAEAGQHRHSPASIDYHDSNDMHNVHNASYLGGGSVESGEGSAVRYLIT